MEHDLFDSNTIQIWLQSKLEVDATPSCKVRAIIYDNQLAGWCGIQLEYGLYEIAVVIDNRFWGLGKKVFKDVMKWAGELGHKEVLIHFLHTRPEYKFLKKIAKSVYESNISGNKFTTYKLKVQ